VLFLPFFLLLSRFLFICIMPKKEPKEIIDPSDALFLIEKVPTHVTFMIARASAIEQYAGVEHALCRLCAHLMKVPVETAGTLFFRMNNARARMQAIGKLVRKNHGTTYNLFWNSLSNEVQAIDQRRNLIVHWTTKKTATSKGESWSSLIGQNQAENTETAEELFLDDLYAFILKCDFFYHIINHFFWVVSGSPKKIDPSWPQICQQPIIYPPPQTHPLFRKWK